MRSEVRARSKRRRGRREMGVEGVRISSSRRTAAASSDWNIKGVEGMVNGVRRARRDTVIGGIRDENEKFRMGGDSISGGEEIRKLPRCGRS